MAKEIVFTENAPKAIGPYVQAIKSNGMIYCSGQLGINALAGKIIGDVEEQAHCSMKNMGAVLEAGGSNYKKIIKTTIFLTNMNDFTVVNKVYESYFEGEFPARSCVQVAKLPLGGVVEVECVAEV